VSDTPGPNVISTAQFNYLAGKADQRLSKEAPPGIAQEDYDNLQLLLILNIIESNKGTNVLTAERLGDYSYSKPTGTNQYLDQYERELDVIRRNLSEAGFGTQGRSDTYMPSMEMDQSQIPVLNTDDQSVAEQLALDQRRQNNGGFPY
jgi:hypothetical protein